MRMMASNNWAVSGDRTASGQAFLCNDPHLEGNRLPNVWSEVVLQLDDRYMAGGSMPGAPGVIIGRNTCSIISCWAAEYPGCLDSTAARLPRPGTGRPCIKARFVAEAVA